MKTMMYMIIYCMIILFFSCKENNLIKTFRYHKKILFPKTYLGFSKVDFPFIPKGTALSGYGLLRSSGKIKSPTSLQIKTFILCPTSPCKPSQALAFIVIDTLGVSGYLNFQIRQQILKLGIPIHQQFIMATHTHSSPDLIGIWGGVSQEFKKQWIEKIKSSVFLSLKKVTQVDIFTVNHQTNLPIINRRIPQKKVNPNTLSIINFRNKNNQDILSLLFYAIHPVFLGSTNKIPSSDFIGDLEKKFQHKFKHTMIYINGAIGNVNPPAINPKNVYDRNKGTFNDIHLFNQKVINEINLFIHKKVKLPIKFISIKTEDLLVDVRNSLLRFLNNIGKVQVNHNKDKHIIAPVSLINLSNQHYWITIPGELFKEYEKQIYEDSDFTNFNILGLCNDSLGYFMPEEQVHKSVHKVEEKFLLNYHNGRNWLKLVKKLQKQ